jgi:DNA-binding transcriptional LysR family regulator
MNLKQLEAFRAVAATGSTTAAAQALDLSQSAVSRLLRQLEARLGIELFWRDKNRLVPTAEALRLVDGVDQAIEGVYRVGRLAEELRLGVRQVLLRVALPPTLAEGVMPPVLEAYFREAPDTTVEILSAGYDAIERHVAEGRADLGFLRLPASYPGLRLGDARPSRSVCVMPQGHKLTRLATVEPADLAGVPLILIGRERASRLETERLFRRHRIDPVVRVEAHTVACACAHVAAGIGVTIVSEVIARAARQAGVVARPFRPAITSEFALAFPASRPASAATKRLAHLLEAALFDAPAATKRRRAAKHGASRAQP